MERPDLENVAAAWEIARYALALEAQLAGVWALMEESERGWGVAGVYTAALRAVLDAPEKQQA